MTRRLNSLRPAQLLWLLIPALVLGVLVLARPGAMKASPPPSALDVRLGFTGFIMAKNADYWMIDSLKVAVDSQTRIDESRYPAKLYAFVGINASHSGVTVRNCTRHDDLTPGEPGR